MTSTDFDSIISSAVNEGDEAKAKRQRRSVSPRYVIKDFVRADIEAHGADSFTDCVQRYCLDRDLCPDFIACDDFAQVVEAIMSMRNAWQNVRRENKTQAKA